MHKKSALAGPGHKRLINLIRGENLQTLGQFAFLAHARPHVGVYGIGALDCVRARRPFHLHAGGRSEAFGTDRAKLEACQPAGVLERTRNVVPVSNVNELLVGKIGPDIEQRQQVCQRLAGMLIVAQRVDNRQRRVSCQLFKSLVTEDTRHDRIDPLRQASGNVWNAFALSQPHFRQQNRPTSQLPDGNFKRDSSTKRGLFKDECDALALERVGIHIS